MRERERERERVRERKRWTERERERKREREREREREMDISNYNTHRGTIGNFYILFTEQKDLKFPSPVRLLLFANKLQYYDALTNKREHRIACKTPEKSKTYPSASSRPNSP